MSSAAVVIVVVLALLAVLGLLLLGRAIARLRRRRRFAAARSGLSASLCLALAALGFALALNLYTYQRLSYEQPVAALRFAEIEPQHYRAVLETPGGDTRTVELRGDQWQLDARVLKWHAVANLLGFDALFRLERLSGRYADIAAEKNRPRSVYAIGSVEPGLDAWALARRLPRWAAFVDSEYGSATYLPMADDAAYAVTLTQSGLAARPANAAARKAIRRWSE